MPIHLYWGDDEAARSRAVDGLVGQLVDPAWASINLSRLDGNDTSQALQALEEARTPPFGPGARLVLLQRSPFCSPGPAELAERLEASLTLIPETCHLVLVSPGKPDARLRSTKALRKVAEEKSFLLPAIWDGEGQVDLVQRTAAELGLRLEPAAAEALAEAIGSDSARLASELEKLALYANAPESGQPAPLTAAAVEALVGGRSTSALAVGEALLAGQGPEAIARADALLAANEPALRIVAALTSQIRGWLWVSLLEQQGEQDTAVIAKAAGIANPKRIYVMRKQLRGRRPGHLLTLLTQVLELEAALKRGAEPGEAFRDAFLVPGTAA
ncbi:MAG: DNA polymerase III subunit delta [Cyanobacteria bacterium]|nr:DNA polymerase III subunit delta [Cyanobacteriota bacterium]